jgi:hypothetical protein
MTGPEHLREADLILTTEICPHACPFSGCVHEMALIARAQVHATLALAAATATQPSTSTNVAEYQAWYKATHGPAPAPEVAGG